VNKVKNYAQFWRCALQVNPSSYNSQYRGDTTGLTENEYNQAILNKCLELDIKIVGIADHGSVSGISGLRETLQTQGIIVFPGFEIASNDKIHFVCLFSDDTDIDTLNRYLGSLELLDPKDGVRPSTLSAEELIKKAAKIGGFIYAAHCTGANGLLKKKLNHVWQLNELQAAQIPGSLDDLSKASDGNYIKIFKNQIPEYHRDHPVIPINAKDIAKPEDMDDLSATCRVKMTRPGFNAFTDAFLDPESRVKLHSDMPKKYYSSIESIKITSGYLDGLCVDFSEHLNAIIGGRGTGKSTLIECIRYVLGKKPLGKEAQKQHENIIKENLGTTRGHIELKVKSSSMNGQCFTISRRYGDITTVKDGKGKPSNFTPGDLLPQIEIFGQNEILEIAQSKDSQRNLLNRFFETNKKEKSDSIELAFSKLAENREKILETENNIAEIEVDAAKLPRLEEKAEIFKKLGIEDKLKIIPYLETEKQLLDRSLNEEAYNLDQSFQSIKDNFLDTTFLNDSVLEKLPHAESLKKIREGLDDLSKYAETQIKEWQKKYSLVKNDLDKIATDVEKAVKKEEEKLETVFAKLPASEGKTGKQIGLEYQETLKKIQRIKPKKKALETHHNLLNELRLQRTAILGELSKSKADRTSQFNQAVSSLNKTLEGKLKISITPESDRSAVVTFLVDCKLDGVAEARLSWIHAAEDFSHIKLAALIRKGTSALKNEKWGITNNVANALVRLSSGQIMELEELDIQDSFEILLNVSHDGKENFKHIDNLSTGQKCTAILHLLLLQNLDPLIMDQPEDNLDNAFIAERIVSELRKTKIIRQFIFATHNANIPVFGDAEWIGVLEAQDNLGKMPVESQGSIDVPIIKEKAAIILEGGQEAFVQRQKKYGFKERYAKD
jgi:ABC-type lipoprotein export system ATPase subunit